jgi:putative tryptophan/tyrosine transport system substrate-binding protein
MTAFIGRREVISLLGGAAAGWPVLARAQQTAMPVVGYLYSGAPETSAHLLAAFRKGLSESGFVEGRNVEIEYRWAHNDPERLPDLAAELVRRRVAILVTTGTPTAALAAKAATTTIPIVFRSGADPVQLGLVAGLNRPGGNITGVSAMSWETETKRLGLLHELLPAAAKFGVLVARNNPIPEHLIGDLQAGASGLGRQIEFVSVSNSREIDTGFADLVQKRIDALLVPAQGLFINRRVQLITLATRQGLPAIYPAREFADIGGLMSYGANAADQFRQAGIYTGRVLTGENPAHMPVLRASKFEFVLNLPTAKAFGLEIPPTLLARADEVIE